MSCRAPRDPGPRTRDLAHVAWLWLLGTDVGGYLDRRLALLRTFLDVYGLADADRRGFGGRVVARVEAEREMHDRAGRVTGPGPGCIVRSPGRATMPTPSTGAWKAARAVVYRDIVVCRTVWTVWAVW
ncbi:hypothetical protein ACWD25_14430 [Streptomyces sp. NPDC002920]